MDSGLHRGGQWAAQGQLCAAPDTGLTRADLDLIIYVAYADFKIVIFLSQLPASVVSRPVSTAQPCQ